MIMEVAVVMPLCLEYDDPVADEYKES